MNPHSQLNMKELVNQAKKLALSSISKDGHLIGAILVDADNNKYFGFNIQKSSVLRSTCAEMMALDNWYQDAKRKTPRFLVLIGNLNRDNWNENFVCLPCGVCREMYHQIFKNKEDRKEFYFDCHSWNTKNKIRKTLRELLYYSAPFYDE